MVGWIDEACGFHKNGARPWRRASHVALPRDTVTLGSDRTNHVQRLSRPEGLRRGGKVFYGRRGRGWPRPCARRATAVSRPAGSWPLCASWRQPEWRRPGRGERAAHHLCGARSRHQQLPPAGGAAGRPRLSRHRRVLAHHPAGRGHLGLGPHQRGCDRARRIGAQRVPRQDAPSPCRPRPPDRDRGVPRGRERRRVPRPHPERGRPRSRDHRPQDRSRARGDRLHAADRSRDAGRHPVRYRRRIVRAGKARTLRAHPARPRRPAPRAPPRRGPPAPRIEGWVSIPLGVVTLAERYGGHEVTRAIFAAMVEEVAQRIAEFAAAHGGDMSRMHMLGTSGTVTTIAGVFLELPRYDRRRVDGCWLDDREVTEVVERLLAMSYAERVANACIGPERADLVLAGCAILEAIRRAFPCRRLRVADRGLREGMLVEMMRADGVWDHPRVYSSAES